MIGQENNLVVSFAARHAIVTPRLLLRGKLLAIKKTAMQLPYHMRLRKKEWTKSEPPRRESHRGPIGHGERNKLFTMLWAKLFYALLIGFCGSQLRA